MTPLKPRVVLTTEDLSKKGPLNIKVITAGIDLKDRFESNPVMLFDHDTSKILGNWTDLELDAAGRMLATPNFDLDDPFAAKQAKKFDKDMLTSASIGIDVVDAYLENEVVVISASTLLEASLVAIPANKKARKVVNLDATSEIEAPAVEHLPFQLFKGGVNLSNLSAEQLLLSLFPKVDEVEKTTEPAVEVESEVVTLESEAVENVEVPTEVEELEAVESPAVVFPTAQSVEETVGTEPELPTETAVKDTEEVPELPFLELNLTATEEPTIVEEATPVVEVEQKDLEIASIKTQLTESTDLVERLQKEIADLELEVKGLLIADAEKEKGLTTVESLALKATDNLPTLREMLAVLEPKQQSQISNVYLSKVIKEAQQAAVTGPKKTYAWYLANDKAGLRMLAKSDPAVYKQLEKDFAEAKNHK